MKKKLARATLLVIVLGMATWNYHNRNEVKMSRLTLENIEALANGESTDTGERGTGPCYNTITNKINSKILYCGTCTYIANSTDSWISGKGNC